MIDLILLIASVVQRQVTVVATSMAQIKAAHNSVVLNQIDISPLQDATERNNIQTTNDC